MRHLKEILKGQEGWTTVEYIVGAVILVTVISTVVLAFEAPLMAKVTQLAERLLGS